MLFFFYEERRYWKPIKNYEIKYREKVSRRIKFIFHLNLTEIFLSKNNVIILNEFFLLLFMNLWMIGFSSTKRLKIVKSSISSEHWSSWSASGGYLNSHEVNIRPQQQRDLENQYYCCLPKYTLLLNEWTSNACFYIAAQAKRDVLFVFLHQPSI